MTVEPGFGGQVFMQEMIPKIAEVRNYIETHHLACRIEVDGGIGPDNLRDVLSEGAEIIVAGSAIFGRKTDASESFREMQGIADRFMKETAGA